MSAVKKLHGTKTFVTSLRTDRKEPNALVTVFKQTATTSLW